jgi:hypothetical protein
MPTTTPRTRRKPKPAPAPVPPPAPPPVCISGGVLCRSDCPYYHKPNDDVWPAQCDDCGKIGYVCGLCVQTKRITGCVSCMRKQG